MKQSIAEQRSITKPACDARAHPHRDQASDQKPNPRAEAEAVSRILFSQWVERGRAYGHAQQSQQQLQNDRYEQTREDRPPRNPPRMRAGGSQPYFIDDNFSAHNFSSFTWNKSGIPPEGPWNNLILKRTFALGFWPYRSAPG